MMSPNDSVKVRVKPNNRYGEAAAGSVLQVTRHELDTNPHCLEEALPFPLSPRTAVVQIPAAKARALGLPLGRRQEGVIAFEVTRMPPGGEAPREAQITVHITDAPEVKQVLHQAARAIDATAAAMGWEDGDSPKAEYVAENIGRAFSALRGDLRRLDDQAIELRQALDVAQQNEAAARVDATRLAQELARLQPESCPHGSTMAECLKCAPPARDPGLKGKRG